MSWTGARLTSESDEDRRKAERIRDESFRQLSFHFEKFMDDFEIDDVIARLRRILSDPDACDTAARAIRCIQGLKARRDELQKAMDDIAFGRA